MGATGIGASIPRQEDHRFITGKGRYVDDINRQGQAYAFFLRSPHAHAKINSIDTKVAESAPGVVAVYTGDDVAADKVGGLICGWLIHSKDGSPMNAGPHPALAQGKVRYVGDHVAVVIADTLAQARDAAEKIEVDYEVLPAVVDLANAQSGAQIHDVAPNNVVYDWHLGDKAATDKAFASAKHVTKLDLVNNRIAPKLSSATPMGATTSPMRSLRPTATARYWDCASPPKPISAPISRPSPPRCRPICTCRCSQASTISRRSTAR